MNFAVYSFVLPVFSAGLLSLASRIFVLAKFNQHAVVNDVLFFIFQVLKTQHKACFVLIKTKTEKLA